jgi:hypothetical protein
VNIDEADLGLCFYKIHSALVFKVIGLHDPRKKKKGKEKESLPAFMALLAVYVMAVVNSTSWIFRKAEDGVVHSKTTVMLCYVDNRRGMADISFKVYAVIRLTYSELWLPVTIIGVQYGHNMTVQDAQCSPDEWGPLLYMDANSQSERRYID